MAKSSALMKNERLKLYKKPSTWILLGVIVALVLLIQVPTMAFSSTGSYYYSTWEQQYASQLESYTMQAKADPDDASAQANAECIRYLLDNSIKPTDWRTGVAYEYYHLKYPSSSNYNDQLKSSSYSGYSNYSSYYSDQSSSSSSSQYSSSVDTAKQMATLKALLDQNDWKAYVSQQIADIQGDTVTYDSDDEKNVELEIYNLYLDKEIVPVCETAYYGGYVSSGDDTGDESWKSTQIQTVRNNKLYLVRGENAQGTLLTYTQRAACQQSIDVALTRLDTNTKPVSSTSFLASLANTASYLELISMLLIVFAGGIISTEFSTGTVKLLLISPNTRQKIFWAKVRLIVEIAFIALGAIFVTSFLVCGLFTGFSGIGSMQVLPLFGSIVRIPYLIYIVLCFLLMLLPVFAYGAMALMMSAVTRKGAVAIAVSLLLIFGSDIVVSLLASFNRYNSIVVPGAKFVLFSNANLLTYLPSASSSTISTTTVDSTMTLGFSVIMLLIYLVCFLWIARDSFCRRDIK